MAPIDRAAQGALALRLVARPAGQIQAGPEPVEDERGAQQADPGGGELDGERQPEQPVADLADDRRHLGVEGHVRPHRQRTSDEQGHAGVGIERRDRMPALARDPEELAARDQEPHRWRAARNRSNDLGAGREQLLQVVEHEQGLSLAQVLAQGAGKRPVR